ncbi:hypothetical protein NPIL_136601 [Nephila pilipes]|uniref:Uncharacterized protein n=1 Tax=Nephila pilipes TaxID=299642 RepID=A0A8X6URW1_NEPPI|nr:hypothetical protein NPIL_136601 [Nephila pilipes]
MKLADQDKSRATHKVCVLCLNDLRFCLKGKKTIWNSYDMEGAENYCYFCSCHVRGYNSKYPKLLSYLGNILSVIHPIPRGPNVVVPLPLTELTVIPLESTDSEPPKVQGSDTEHKPSGANHLSPTLRLNLMI